MADKKNLRAEFAATSADDLARQLGGPVVDARQPEKAAWSKFAVWYVDEAAVTAVVGDQEGKNVDDVLGYGLLTAGDRRLRLVLPEGLAGPSLIRAPWFDHPVEIRTHVNGSVSDPIDLTRDQTMREAGGTVSSPSLHLANVPARVRELVEWATDHPDLEAAHRPDKRAWTHAGQQVLTIKGTRSLQITAGIDAKNDPAGKFTAGELEVQGVSSVQQLVESGIEHARSEKYQKAAEHRLQSILRARPNVLRLEHPVLREVPAHRPAGRVGDHGRGFIDLLGLDGFGDIVVVETKLGGDHMLVLQGLDYWIWATHNLDWLRDHLHASPQARLKLLFAVAGDKDGAPVMNSYARRQLALLSPDVDRSVVQISDWASVELTTTWGPKTGAEH